MGIPGTRRLRGPARRPFRQPGLQPLFRERGTLVLPLKTGLPAARARGPREDTDATKSSPCSLSAQKEGSGCSKTGLKMAWLYLSYLLWTESLQHVAGFHVNFLANPPLLALMPTLQYQPRLGDLRGITDPQSFNVWEKECFLKSNFTQTCFQK